MKSGERGGEKERGDETGEWKEGKRRGSKRGKNTRKKGVGWRIREEDGEERMKVGVGRRKEGRTQCRPTQCILYERIGPKQ